MEQDNNVITTSVYSYINKRIDCYKWIIKKLSPELRLYILNFACPIQEGLNYYNEYGPCSTLIENRLKGFPIHQNPTILGVPGLLNNNPWHEIPSYIKETLNDALLASIRIEYYQLSNLKDDYWTENISLPLKSYHDKYSKNKQWKVYHIMEEGHWNIQPCELCPNLYKWLKTLPVCDCSFGYIYFSVLSSGTVIAPHYGSSNCKLRIQIPIIVPDNNDNCILTVGGESRVYQKDPSAIMVFDDSYLHSVHNKTDQDRIVLLIDVWNPELSLTSIAKIKESFQCQSFSDGHFYYPIVSSESNNNLHDISYDYLLKFLSIGDSGVGKSFFTLRASKSDMPDQVSFISTIGVDFKIFKDIVRNAKVKIQMWDTAGPERFRTITSSYYRGAHVIFILFDTTDNSNPFKSVDFWIDQTIQNASKETLVVIVGTKIDLVAERQVSYKEASDYARSKELPYFEISSVTGENISSLIQFAVKRRLDRMLKTQSLNISSTKSSSSSKKFKCTIS